ncbi:hypothetical protein ACJX0J_030903, partial [Zea mays]
GRGWQANEMARKMYVAGIKLDEITYNLIIKGFFMRGEHEMAKTVFGAMHWRGCKPNTSLARNFLRYFEPPLFQRAASGLASARMWLNVVAAARQSRRFWRINHLLQRQRLGHGMQEQVPSRHSLSFPQPLLADIVQAEDIKELCKLLVVVSREAAKAYV